MGQGFSLATPSAGSASIDVPELRDLVYEKSIGNATLMKSVRARHHDGVVLVKVLVKPYTPMPLEKYRRDIIEQRKALADVPNALAFQRIIETETNGFLVRQFMYSSLYDRISTRPFLEDIEKKWLAFQLLCALRDCHARDVYHGDIKAQNVLVTSWNWLYLTDFSSSFKPVMLPDDNPADFSYYFDTVGKRTCYIAPERFLFAGETAPADASLTWAMDVFSAGCVIAQLFLETEFFTLSQLYRYRRGEYDPTITALGAIPDRDVREMISHMIQLDPERRYSAEQYLEFWRGKVFPEYFYSFLHQYMGLITDPSSGNNPISNSTKNLGEADERIDRVFYDFDKISYFLGYQDDKRAVQVAPTSARLGITHFPVRLNIPNHEHYVSAALEPPEDDGTLIFLTLVVSSIRNTARAASKVRACDVLLAFAERLTDEAKLDRVLPYLVSLLTDKADIVVVSAIRSIAQLLQLVQVVTPINSHVFVEYILPRLQVALYPSSSNKPPPSPIVRSTYASCIGSLASTATRFLEMAASLKGDGSFTVADPEVEPGAETEAAFDGLFDNAQRQLFELFEIHTKALVEDSDIYVRRAFLTSVPELCMFFGPADSNDILLTHLNTYLNDRDWMLKSAFFETIVGISTLVGTSSLEEFILPLMTQALTDPEEWVMQAALHSLAQIAGLGLLSRDKVWVLVDVVGRFTMHPNQWIRAAAAEFISASTKYLTPADIRCIILPLVRPYLKPSIIPNFSELELLDALQRPLSRSVLEQALVWAAKTDKGVFWKSLQQLRSLASTAIAARSSRTLTPQSLGKVPRNEEDDQWLSKLRSLGLAAEDEVKLLALREFIWRLSKLKARNAGANETVNLNEVVSLKSLGITPQTVFFDEKPLEQPLSPDDQELAEGSRAPYTIADALLDASMTIDDPVAKRKKAALNSHKARGSNPASPHPHDRRTLSAGPSRRGSSRASGQRVPLIAGVLGGSAVDDDTSVSEAPYASRRLIRHQSSALSLLDRKDTNKSVAETATTSANVFGQVEGPFAGAPPPPSQLATSPSEIGSSPPGIMPKIKANHSYQGNDPSILKMLDEMYIDNYPHDIVEFGPIVQPISRKKASRANGQAAEPWRPTGRLVATFSEHHGAINRVVASPDHVFFITGGDDGVVKVWDTGRLERSTTHRSRQTHRHATGSRVLALCFIENTHCFISCADDGSVHVVKVDTAPTSNALRYPKLRLLREYKLPAGEHAVWVEHFKAEAGSVMVLATNRSRVLGIDLRTMSLLYVLENPVHHGTPTCFCIDKKRNWLCLGTSHGVLDLWDLRFKMRLKAWGVPGGTSIHRVCVHPVKGRGKWVCVAGGTGQGEVTVWDLEKMSCREIYRAGGNKEGPRGYEAWEVDDEGREGMLGRFATAIEPGGGGGAGGAGSADRGVRAMAVGTAAGEDPRDVRHAFLVTGGSDKKLRFWDLSRIENSVVYSGARDDEARSSFAASHPTGTMTLNTEKVTRQGAGAGKGSSGGGGKGKAARSTVISSQQQQLLRSHLDAIMDVALLESPYTMTVSVDRSGVVFVFQ
ncbi:related to protein kinase homolog VPS15 [Cephalotrichum gorgonifer]|uniref:non-specific serine/threonine protein kinase n=1 Tax=Cephalotrichum gorgonifer TaxID=2041049 RepID=A0AAE8N689_9PEZI|nr:related to protein kinase homolog VPS15 [Cephalotrichum gorgonifer]